MKELINIKYWIFDLDNTLYSGQTKVFLEIDKKMSAYISKKLNIDLIKAKEIQKKYFYENGTTLSGLMKHNNIDPYEFLEFVHQIDISWLPKDKLLRKELKSRRLLLMTDVEGVLDKNKKLIPEITPNVAKKMINEDIITGGMIPKINTCIDAVNNGVKGVVIIDGRRHHSILFELLSDKGSGTLIR